MQITRKVKEPHLKPAALKKLRINKNVKIIQMARALGTSPQTIWYCERSDINRIGMRRKMHAFLTDDKKALDVFWGRLPPRRYIRTDTGFVLVMRGAKLVQTVGPSRSIKMCHEVL